MSDIPHYTVSELAFGFSQPRRTRGSGKRPPDKACALVDIRGQSRAASIQVWSPAGDRLVNLPRSLIKIETEGAHRFAAVTMPRWLWLREQLYTPAPQPPCATFRGEPIAGASAAQVRDDREYWNARFVVDTKNRYVRLPGQQMQPGSGQGRIVNAGS